MKIAKKILEFLEKKEIRYRIIGHRTVYTAMDKAATLKVLPKIIGKSLVVRFDKTYALVLISADSILDKSKLKKAVNLWLKEQDRKPAKSIDFAREGWMKKNLKGIKVGATPPFGSIWKLPTFVEKSLLKNKKLIVNAGDYIFSLEILSSDLKKIDDLVVASIAAKKPKRKSIPKKK